MDNLTPEENLQIQVQQALFELKIMSYIDLINAFEKWLETNYLPSSAQLLWYKLIMLFNKCRVERMDFSR